MIPCIWSSKTGKTNLSCLGMLTKAVNLREKQEHFYCKQKKSELGSDQRNYSGNFWVLIMF